MNYPSIHVEGAILSPDILDRLEDLPGQKPADFGFAASAKVKDEIVRAWADAQDYWRIFQRKLESLNPNSPATSETRQQWIAPLLGLLGYQLEYQARGAEWNGKLYTISHRAANRAHAPVQIVGYREPAALDRKPAGARMSAHGVVQEFLNLSEMLYGMVTNGRVLRLLRDSSRLVKLTYLQFDLDRIFNDGLYADFAVLYRLLHASRLPQSSDAAAESWIERYHQDSLDSGARIREGLSRAVETAVRDFANGFLCHSDNGALRAAVSDGTLQPKAFYRQLLGLIYRLLFLMVIEERDLVYPPGASQRRRDLYRRFYSLQRLRLLSEKRYLASSRYHDLWLALMATFRLFEDGGPGNKLGIAPLAGDLFDRGALGTLGSCRLTNDVLLGCLRSLSLYEHPESGQMIRVNYGALNVEEFGSVYEGLLEFSPAFVRVGAAVEFVFEEGEERAATGSHYTPDDLVQPLIKHSLDYLIADRLKAAKPEEALLDLRVADIACGSGHILLAAARRIATELAAVRTGEEQPTPEAYRAALRDVVRNCIYGVDLNPLAVELCKVALWLEAHNPGLPLNFLDHHIKCGNAILGYVRRDDLNKGVPDEAFATRPGDDKDVASQWRKTNKRDRAEIRQIRLAPEIQRRVDDRLGEWQRLSALPERTPAEIAAKKAQFDAFAGSADAERLDQIAAIPIAQFYIPRNTENEPYILTDSTFRRFWADGLTPQGQGAAMALAIAREKRFFHWFLEFPDIVARGGFDCILGNPPYLGGTNLSGTYGHSFCTYVKWMFAPAGLSELVVYFVRRLFTLLKPNSFTAFITTNSIRDGRIREDGLDHVLDHGGKINMAVRGIKWPGRANLVVSLLAIHNGELPVQPVLDGRRVPVISSYFEESIDLGEVKTLEANADRVFEGSKNRGEGFFITHEEAATLIGCDLKNAEVVIPILSGGEITEVPDIKPQRWAIFFQDWPESKAAQYNGAFEFLMNRVDAERRSEADSKLGQLWWRFERPRMSLYRKLKTLDCCFAACATAKYLGFVRCPTNHLFTQGAKIFATARWDLYAVVQSTMHEVWARKYSGALKQDLRYSPSKCFETFAFPEGLWQTANPALAALGERYHEHRKCLMLGLWIGLTDIYNLFHARDLSPAKVAKVSKKSAEESARGFEGLLQMRRLHRELDLAIRDTYGWQNLPLDHDFHEVETLAENDRLRYTISADARKELLRRLLALNHASAEAEKGAPKATKPRRGKKASAPIDEHVPMFTEED